jgi:hypothetical protein
MVQYAWFDNGKGRQVYRPIPEPQEDKRSSLAMPYFRQDHIKPCLGADGKVYDTLSGYRKTLLPSGNPKGERYIELGNEQTKPYEAPKFDRKKRRDDIKAAIADVKNGNVPKSTQL